LWSVKGRVKARRIEDAGKSAMFGQLRGVDGEDDGFQEPDRAHYFASSRRTLRRCFMID